MPTGYTDPISKGITFKEYALWCARAFGALIHMRDDPSSATIREDEVSDYHTKAIAEARTVIKQVGAMTAEEASAAAFTAFQEDVAARDAAKERTASLRANYEVMLALVEAYEPPTPGHVEFKNFMASQIRESIQFDCHDGPSDWQNRPVVRLSGEEWRTQQIAKAERDLAYHQKSHLEEIERINGRNEWIRQLVKSLE